MGKKKSYVLFSALALFFLLGASPVPAEASVARSLYAGLSGADVKALQETLVAKGYLAEGKATGYFGSLTEAAVKKFQCDKQIICSGAGVSGYGIAGAKTQAALSDSGAQLPQTQARH